MCTNWCDNNRCRGCGVVGKWKCGCAWLVECGGMHWCSAVGCMLCDVVCAVAYVVGCLLRLSGGGTAKCAVGGWVGASTAAEGAGVSTCAIFFGASSSVKVEADLFPVMEGGCPCPLG